MAKSLIMGLNEALKFTGFLQKNRPCETKHVQHGHFNKNKIVSCMRKVL